MDNTETHYLTYDPDAIWEQMMANYVEAGGDILYPGDEKYMLLKSVELDIVQIFAGVDNALRMGTLRYAVGVYLDLLGEQRNCPRIQATRAEASVTITTNATGKTQILEAGTAMTGDGEVFYLLEDDLTLSGYAQTVTVPVVADRAGSAGNGLLKGTEMGLAITNSAVRKIVAASDAKGGNEEEDDDTYRDRIREYGLASVSTGPQRQYEAQAKAVSSEILDAKAVNEGGGNVGIYLILSSETGAAAILQSVKDKLSGVDTRPLTDNVAVYRAEDVPYVLNVQYSSDSSSDTSAAIAKAVAEYTSWQDETIGRPFNPDRLMAAIYQAGATRVIWGEGSKFNGNGTVTYTEIAETKRCKGQISLSKTS